MHTSRRLRTSSGTISIIFHVVVIVRMETNLRLRILQQWNSSFEMSAIVSHLST